MNKMFYISIGCIFSLLFSVSLFAASNSITDSDFTIDLVQLDPVNQSTPNITGGSSAVTQLLEKITRFLIFVIPLIAAVSILIAGYYYVLSGGDSEKASRAKTIIKWNAVAIFLALGSYALVATIASILDAQI